MLKIFRNWLLQYNFKKKLYFIKKTINVLNGLILCTMHKIPMKIQILKNTLKIYVIITIVE